MKDTVLFRAQQRVGERFWNKQRLEAKIIGVCLESSSNYSTLYRCQFIESGYEFISELGNLKKGTFKDYGRPTVYGVGYSCKNAKSNLMVYKTWSHMLERCYNKKCSAYDNYGGRGVRVCDRWLYFENFREDVKKLPRYDKMMESPAKYSLDKDILGDGTIYSPETCMFATSIEQSRAQNRSKKIKAIDSEGNEYFFHSPTAACRALGVQNANLYKVLSGERKHTLGYTFEEVDSIPE